MTHSYTALPFKDVPAASVDPAEVTVAFHGSLPEALWTNIMQAFLCKGVVDLSAVSGESCKAAMTLKRVCLAFCMSDTHRRLLHDHLVDWMLGVMEDTSHPLGVAAYKVWKTSPSSSSSAPPLPTPGRKRSRSKSNKQDKKTDKAKSKKKSKKSESSSSSSD
jgi:hypothetical protein